MHRRSRLAPLIALVALAPAPSAAQEGPEPEGRPPLPEGHYRIVSVELASTFSVSVIEAVIEGPAGSSFTLQVDDPAGPQIRSRSSLVGEDGEPSVTVRIVAKVDRFGMLGPSPSARGAQGSFSIFTRHRTGGGGGGSSIDLPADQPAGDLLTPSLEPGDHKLGSAVEAFRFQDDRYSIRVN